MGDEAAQNALIQMLIEQNQKTAVATKTPRKVAFAEARSQTRHVKSAVVDYLLKRKGRSAPLHAEDEDWMEPQPEEDRQFAPELRRPKKPIKPDDPTKEEMTAYWKDVDIWMAEMSEYNTMLKYEYEQRTLKEATVAAQAPEGERRGKKQVYEKIGTLQKFNYSTAKTMPFAYWWSSFSREMAALDLDDATILLNLKHWVADEIWRPLSISWTKDQATNPEFVVAELERHLKDPIPLIVRREEFMNFHHRKPDVLAYSKIKEFKFQLGYPDLTVESNEFYMYWLAGLFLPWRFKLNKKGMQDYPAALQHCLRWEYAHKSTFNYPYIDSYGNPGGPPNPNITQRTRTVPNTPNQSFQRKNTEAVVCRQWMAKGECSYGDSCRYKHPRKKTEAVTATRSRDVEQRNFRDPLSTCKNYECKGDAPHAWTKCTKPRFACPLCKKKGHTKHYCPQAVCANCSKSGHTDFVCTQAKK